MKKLTIALALMLLNVPQGWAGRIHDAVISGDLTKVRYLLERLDIDVDARDDEGRTPLYWAAGGSDPEMVRYLLKHNANVGAQTNQGAFPLFKAVHNGNLQIVRLLLLHHAEVNATDRDGFSSLHLAAYNGDPDIAEVLLDRGATVDARDNFGATPLHYASHYDLGEGEMARCLEESDVDYVRSQWRVMGKGRQLDAARVLLERQASVDAQDNRGHTPLHGAASSGDLDMVNLLLENQADPQATSQLGKSPLSLAQEGEQIQVVEAIELHLLPPADFYLVFIVGGKQREEAEMVLEYLKETTAIVAGPGFPRIMDSGRIHGMRAGFHLVILGQCANQPQAQVVRDLLRSQFPDTYTRKIYGPFKETCPLVPAVSPPQVD